MGTDADYQAKASAGAASVSVLDTCMHPFEAIMHMYYVGVHMYCMQCDAVSRGHMRHKSRTYQIFDKFY